MRTVPSSFAVKMVSFKGPQAACKILFSFKPINSKTGLVEAVNEDVSDNYCAHHTPALTWVQVPNVASGLVTHNLICDGDDLSVSQSKVHASDWCLVRNGEQFSTTFHSPHFHVVVCSSTNNALGMAWQQRSASQGTRSILTININRPHSTSVSIVCSQTFTIVCEPNTALGVFAGGEDQISLSVVFDIGDGSLVTLQQNRSHGEVVCDAMNSIQKWPRPASLLLCTFSVLFTQLPPQG